MKHGIVLMAVIGLSIFLFITLTTSPPATAVSLSDQHYSHTFTVGNDTWTYVDITRDNSSVNATGEVWFWASNLTVMIVEDNIQNATIHTAEILNQSGLTDAQIREYIAITGRLTVVVSGEGTDKFIIEDLPEVVNIYVDGSSYDFTWSDNTLIFTIAMSEHDIIIDFSAAAQIDSLTAVITNTFFPLVIIVVIVGVVFKSFKGFMK